MPDDSIQNLRGNILALKRTIRLKRRADNVYSRIPGRQQIRFDQRLPRRRHIYKTSARRHADGLRAHESISGGDARNLSLMPAGSKHFQDILFWIGLDAQRSCPAVILSGNSYLL